MIPLIKAKNIIFSVFLLNLIMQLIIPYRLLIINLLLLLSTLLAAQNHLFQVEKINIKDGLPNRMPFDIIQDKKGFIWVSSPGKISRYDGQQFQTYDAGELNIPDGRNTHLVVDKTNKIWFQAYEGDNLPVYNGVIDIEKDTIYSVELFANGLFKANDILFINQSTLKKDEFFISTRQGIIYKYGEEIEEIYQLKELGNESVICEQDREDAYWIANYDTLIKVVNHQKEQLLQLPKVENPDSNRFFKKLIRQYPTLIFETTHRTLGNQYWEVKENRLIPYTPLGYEFEKTISLFPIDNNNTCFITKDELLIKDTLGKIIFQYGEFEEKVYGNRKLKYKRRLIDTQGNLWLSTENGLLKINHKKNPFTILSTKNSIRGIYSTVNKLLIGGYLGNFQYDIESKTTNIFFDSPSPISGFYKDHKGHLWIGTMGRTLLECPPEKERLIEHSHNEPFSLYLPFENSVTKRLWLGTNQGLAYFDRTNQQIVKTDLPIVSTDMQVNQFHLNKEGIWMVTSKGIFLLDVEKDIVIDYYNRENGLPYDNINHLHEDNQGIFWLATREKGLVRWDRSTNNFTQFDEKNGLSNLNLYAVYEDDYGFLWLPSDYGLNRFNKNTLRDNEVYLPQNGIAHEEFNTFAHHQAADGTLYFGGLNGVTKFHPKDFQQQETTSIPLFLTVAKVFPVDKGIFLDKTKEFLTNQHIILNAEDRILELTFSLLDYVESDNRQYAYRIKGVQEQWIYTNDNTISFLNLPYGDFVLELKGRGASGNWSKKVFSIPLSVLKPFYLQSWFLISILALVIFTTFIWIRWSIAKLKKDKERLVQEVKKRTKKIEKDKKVILAQSAELKQLDKAKTHFFSNITHEFRTPLTLIIGPLQQMVKTPTINISPEQLHGVLRNAKSLLQLINQLLDISKLEAGKMKLEVSKGDIIGYTKELVGGFKTLAIKKNQRLVFFFPKNEWEIHFDKNKWDKIIYNLLFNALKFTPKDGAIQLSLSKITKQETQWVYLKIKDSGLGIAEKQLAQIFNRFYQGDSSSTRQQEGTGIGLSLVKELIELQGGKIWVSSKVGKGTSFDIQIPVLRANKEIQASHLPIKKRKEDPIQATTILINNGKSIITKQSNNNKEKLQLLLIEDNAEMRDYIKSCIDSTRFHIVEAKNGAEGIQKAQELIPDLIISDVMMPLKDGFEVTETVRTNRATSHIPIILLTAKAALESRLEGFQKGADAYLSKPFSPEELVLRIQKLIEIRQLLQQRYKTVATTPLAQPTKQYNTEDIFITKLKKYIKKNLQDTSLNGDVLGKAFRMSRMQLHRKLKALTNQPTSEFIQSIRLDTAIKLLTQKELNISEIAYQTGFSSPSHFSRVFKKKYGKTPSEFLN